MPGPPAIFCKPLANKLPKIGWDTPREFFQLYTSELVIAEISEGDTDASRRRISVVRDLPLLSIADEVLSMARDIMDAGILPERAVRDAIHVSMAAVHGIDILLTWNCRHIANGSIIRQFGDIAESRGLNLPVICTPEELLEEVDS